MKRPSPCYLALLWMLVPGAPAHSDAFAPASDVLLYSTSGPEVALGDGATRIDAAEVAIFDRYRQTYGTLHQGGLAVCETGAVVEFGGLAYFMEALGAGGDVDVDALSIDAQGRIAFSTSGPLPTTTPYRTVQDGSVLVIDPSVPPLDPTYFRYVVRENDLFPDVPLVSEQDVVFFSVTSTSGVMLSDGETTVTRSEVAIAHVTDEPFLGETPHVKVPDSVGLMYPGGFAVCGQQVVARFGSDALFEALGEKEKVGIDALHVLAGGQIAFSTAADFHSSRLGLVKDGSVVVFDPFVPFGHERSLRYLVSEDVLFADFADGAANNADVDAFAIHDGKYYLSTASTAVLNGIEGEPVIIGDTDVAEYDPVTGRARVFLSGSAIFPPGLGQPDTIDIDGLSFNRHGELVFSIRETAIMKDGFELTDGALGVYDPATTDVRVYALQSALFAEGQSEEADISALHIDVGRDGGDCAPRMIDKGLVQNDQDIDAFAVDRDGVLYFSIAKAEGVLSGHAAEPLVIRDGDIIAFEPATGIARVAYREDELFANPGGSMSADIDALAFDPAGNLVLSVKDAAVVRSGGVELAIDDGSLVVIDAVTGMPASYALESGELFASSAAGAADLDALDIMPALDDTCSPVPAL